MPTSLVTFDVSIPSWASSFLPLSHHWNFSGRPQRYERRSNNCRYTGSTAQNIRFREPRSTKTGGTLPRAARTASGALGVTPNTSSGTPRRERCLTPGMELTAYSVRSCLAPAFGSSSYLALGAKGTMRTKCRSVQCCCTEQALHTCETIVDTA